jgi:ATP-dependent Clp protease ATP-binding subunit ClpA
LLTAGLLLWGQQKISNRQIEKLTGGRTVEDPLGRYTTNLADKARAGKTSTYIGRQEIFEELIQIFGRKKKPNPLIVGKPGVGKTALVEALQTMIVEGKIPKEWLKILPWLADAEILQVDLKAIEADNTENRGGFEKNFEALWDAVMEERKKGRNIILFFDEAHLMVSAGSAKDTPGLGQAMKTRMIEDGVPIIGATTDYEVEFIDNDEALERRFGRVYVYEPTTDETLAILKGVVGGYEKHHGISYSEEALAEVVRSAPQKYDKKGRPAAKPDPQITILDDIPTWFKMKHPGENEIKAEHVREWVDMKVAIEAAAKQNFASPMGDPAALMANPDALLRLLADPDALLHASAESMAKAPPPPAKLPSQPPAGRVAVPPPPGTPVPPPPRAVPPAMGLNGKPANLPKLPSTKR